MKITLILVKILMVKTNKQNPSNLATLKPLSLYKTYLMHMVDIIKLYPCPYI